MNKGFPLLLGLRHVREAEAVELISFDVAVEGEECVHPGTCEARAQHNFEIKDDRQNQRIAVSYLMQYRQVGIMGENRGTSASEYATPMEQTREWDLAVVRGLMH